MFRTISLFAGALALVLVGHATAQPAAPPHPVVVVPEPVVAAVVPTPTPMPEGAGQPTQMGAGAQQAAPQGG